MNIEKLKEEALAYDMGDPKRIQHFIKVHSFAKMIGTAEGLSTEDMDILETAAVLHDIGIKNAELKYGSSSGKYQEIEGVPAAKVILSDFTDDKDFISEVCYLISHHHTYAENMPRKLRILMEADFLVNAYEDEMSIDAIKNVRTKLFATECGTRMLDKMFGL